MQSTSTRISARALRALAVLPLLAVSGLTLANGIGINACIGIGAPDLSDGKYDCRATDTVYGAESGSHLYIDWQANDGDALQSIVVDFAQSANTAIQSRSAFFPDNTDGAVIVSENIAGNTFEASFANFYDAVDNFYIGFNLDQVTPNGRLGIPVDPDLEGTELRVETRYGRRFSCTFRHVDQFTAYAGDPLPSTIYGRFVKLRWLLPCQEFPLFELNPELIDLLREGVQRVESTYCEENPDSPLCREGKEFNKK